MYAYVWNDANGDICFKPPVQGGFFRNQLNHRDATKRRMQVNENGYKYWVFDRSELEWLASMFSLVGQIEGWMIVREEPDFGMMESMRQGGDDPYAHLFVMATAPKEVVDAAYKALSRKYHPDAGGGDDEKMKLLNVSLDVIYKDKGW